MKAVWVYLLALACTAGSAKSPHVELAYDLYSGCVRGTLSNKYPPPTKEKLNILIEETDNWCMAWMISWYPVGVSDLEDAELNSSEMERFTILRNLIKGQIRDEMTPYIKSK